MKTRYGRLNSNEQRFGAEDNKNDFYEGEFLLRDENMESEEELPLRIKQ